VSWTGKKVTHGESRGRELACGGSVRFAGEREKGRRGGRKNGMVGGRGGEGGGRGSRTLNDGWSWPFEQEEY